MSSTNVRPPVLGIVFAPDGVTPIGVRKKGWDTPESNIYRYVSADEAYEAYKMGIDNACRAIADWALEMMAGANGEAFIAFRKCCVMAEGLFKSTGVRKPEGDL